jgi:hypothetical protein
LGWLPPNDDRKSLGLAAVKEAGGEEDDCDHQGQARVQHVVQAKAEEGIAQPCSEANKPDPSCLSHHRSCSSEKLSQVEQAQFDGLVLH